MRFGRWRIRFHRAPQSEQDLIEMAWVIIANAGWDDCGKSAGWQEAAVRWRDNYHHWLDRTRTDAQ